MVNRTSITKLLVAFVMAGCTSSAFADRTRCAAVASDDSYGPSSGTLLFGNWPVDEIFSTPTGGDQHIVSADPQKCDAVTVTSFQQGPYLVTDPFWTHDYSTSFYRTAWQPPFAKLSPGKDCGGKKDCTVVNQCAVIDLHWALDANGFGTGAGVMCATESNGPTLTIAPLQLKVNTRRTLLVRIMRNGAPFPATTTVRLVPQQGSGYFDPPTCSGRVDVNGYLQCPYNAPDKPIVERVIATVFEDDTAEGTITVTPPKIVLGFFNGVWNTEKQAETGLDAIRDLAGPTHGDIEIRYEKFYNQTGRSTGNTNAQDIAETFIQRSNELDGVLANRWEHYWELLAGRQGTAGSLTDRLLSGLREGSSALSSLIDSIVSSMLAGFVKGLAQMVSDPPTEVDMAAHLSRLQALADEGNDFVLVAHSQGNLFMNIGYDRLRDSRPDTRQAAVHVAPASPTLRGEHVQADIDQVINGLRNFGSWTVQPINFWMPLGLKTDPSGHTLVGTYLDGERKGSPNPKGDPQETSRDHVKGMIIKALDKVSVP